MPFDPLNFLQLATALASHASSEAEYRTCVGRTYYCLFLIARERFRNRLPARDLRRNAHKNVIKMVKKRQRFTGDQLDKLFSLRKEADYELSPSKPEYANWPRNWQTADLLANEILPRIQRI